MGLAKYFSKDVLAITQILNQGSAQCFESILNKNIVEIIFNSNKLTEESKTTLDLSVRLLSRLYPKIKIADLGSGNNNFRVGLKETAIAINSNIEIVEELATVGIVVGEITISNSTSKLFYIGSDGWTAKLSTRQAVGSGNSCLPFAAGFAACIAASNIFRFVFRELIADVQFDEDLTISLLDFSFNKSEDNVLEVRSFDDVILAGLGAIGNGVLWTLSKLKHIEGNIVLIDPETVSLSNLQRYVMTKEPDEGVPKSEIAQQSLSDTKFTIQSFQGSWQSYMGKRKSWDLDFVITALDSAKDRIAVQASLPKYIINGFTEQGLLGISRHYQFSETACIGCMYLPSEKKTNRSEEVAKNLGIPQHEKQVRNYLYLNSPIDENLLRLIAESNKIDLQALKHFIGTPMSEFYSNFVCGGVLLSLKTAEKNSIQLEAPLVFQSVLSGILLVAELYLFKAGYRYQSFPNVTHIYPLLPLNYISNPYNHTLPKDKSTRCICSDEDYKSVYNKKWDNLN